MAHYRVGRLEQEIQREVNDILLKRVRDPRVKNVNITGVRITGDLQQAKVYYSIFSDKVSDNEKAQVGMSKATRLIRRELAARLNTYKVPELMFLKDDSVAYGSHIDEMLGQMHKDDPLF